MSPTFIKEGADSFVHKTERPWPNRRLTVGAIVGHTTPDACRLWVRTGGLGQFALLLISHTSQLPREELKAKLAENCGQFRAKHLKPGEKIAPAARWIPFQVKDWATDSTVVLELDKLQPNTIYQYAILRRDIRQVILGHDRPAFFRTLDSVDSRFSFGFYSCHMPYQQTLFKKTRAVNMELWDYMEDAFARHAKDEFRFVIAGGDQAYADGVKTLDIWKYLNKVMRKDAGVLQPSLKEMVSWYRDIYRGYWGFSSVQRILSSYPTYMIWDDHEICDGWGSYYFKDGKKGDELRRVLRELDVKEKGLSWKDGKELFDRMGEAARQVYEEYEHCHNPKTDSGQFDYSFRNGTSAFYVLDGRGYRDVNRPEFKVLGKPQFERFKNWVEKLDPKETKFVFVVSAVPVLHLRAALVNQDTNKLIEKLGLSDDLRDSWEHEIHNAERRALIDVLFGAAQNKGIRVAILSGDVHTSAVFKMKREGSVIYQLTSSAITFNVSRSLGWLLGAGVPDDGKSPDGYDFERLALYTDSNFSIIRVDPQADSVVFQLYGEQAVTVPQKAKLDGDTTTEQPISHALAKIVLDFKA